MNKISVDLILVFTLKLMFHVFMVSDRHVGLYIINVKLENSIQNLIIELKFNYNKNDSD